MFDLRKFVEKIVKDSNNNLSYSEEKLNLVVNVINKLRFNMSPDALKKAFRDYIIDLSGNDNNASLILNTDCIYLKIENGIIVISEIDFTGEEIISFAGNGCVYYKDNKIYYFNKDSLEYIKAYSGEYFTFNDINKCMDFVLPDDIVVLDNELSSEDKLLTAMSYIDDLNKTKENDSVLKRK